MKILSAEQIRAWDKYTIENEPVSSIDLMERAATKCTEWIIKHFANSSFTIVCGKGNNGGDGLAVARQLAQQGIKVSVYILETGNNGSKDFDTNLSALGDTVSIKSITGPGTFPEMAPEEIIIECLFGTGLSRPLEGIAADLVEHLNHAQVQIISIDMPAGMFADNSSVGNTMVKATHTLTFQTPKLAFLLPENQDFTGEIEVLDIGLHSSFLKDVNTRFNLTTFDYVRSVYKPRKKYSHKGTFGHALVIAGSKGKMGACILSSKACLRSGCGLVSVAVPEWGMQVIQTTFHEAMALPFEQVNSVDWNMYDAIGIGPGLGTHQDAADLVSKTLSSSASPMVIDADGLNILSKNREWFELIPPGSIITPHPKEFERLFGEAANDFDKLTLALDNAAQYGIYIVLKGHHTLIAFPNGTGFFNSTGNAGMATAGSGDVLTGILTGLLCQGYEGGHAAVLGVYLHGLAGDVAASASGQEALIAGDIIKNLGKAFKRLSGDETVT